MGLTFSDNMKWNKHIVTIFSVSKITGILRKLKYYSIKKLTYAKAGLF